MPRDDDARIQDIVDACRRIQLHIVGLSEDQFVKNETVLRAVLYDIAIIGEAAKGVSGAVRLARQTVPWAKMAGMRDVVIHQYFGIDKALAWQAAAVDVPSLLRALAAG